MTAGGQTASDDTIERAARRGYAAAIEGEYYPPQEKWECLPEWLRDHWRKTARAILGGEDRIVHLASKGKPAVGTRPEYGDTPRVRNVLDRTNDAYTLTIFLDRIPTEAGIEHLRGVIRAATGWAEPKRGPDDVSIMCMDL
jgi:ribosome modulation factor